jgi:A/G-specific adenine glycosylase
MAQQTQIDRVIPKWREFLALWPDPTSAAAAPLADLLRVWSGLGYPRRAKALWETARVIRDEHSGAVPRSLEELLALPGVGAYTARAVLAFAFEADTGVVDTNIARILARTSGRRLSPKEAQQIADAAVPVGAGWAFNQALMDLGAMVCRPQPACESCPLEPECAWAIAGHPLPDPAERSASVSRPQSAFAGSDRQFRGRILRAVHAAPLELSEVTALCGLGEDPDRAARIFSSLLEDGLVSLEGSVLSLAVS